MAPEPADVVALYCQVMNSPYTASDLFSNNLVLDWFGRTIVGRENVFHFLFDEIHLTNHDLIHVKTNITDATRRMLDRFCQPSFTENQETELNESGFWSINSSFSSCGSLTPCSKMASDLSKMKLKPKESPSPICQTPMNGRSPCTPTRPKMAVKNLKLIEAPKDLDFLSAAGILTFSNQEFYTPSKSWTRPCHLQIGYSCQGSITEPISISVIIYNNDMPCRRNLSHFFS